MNCHKCKNPVHHSDVYGDWYYCEVCDKKYDSDHSEDKLDMTDNVVQCPNCHAILFCLLCDDINP